MEVTFSFRRLCGLVIKELTQFRRDHTTFAMVISLPIVQLVLFGFAINTNPKHLPSALINSDNGPFSRILIQGFQNTDYFKFNHYPAEELAAKQLMEKHQVLFILNIPSDFSRKIVKGENPSVLLEVDGTDPVSVGYALSASSSLIPHVLKGDLTGLLAPSKENAVPFNFIIHTKYNPTAITQYNIVPGLLGTVLTMTFVMVASMALTRERERGTLEGLLTTPILPLEVIVGKSIPFLIVGYLQVVIVLFLAVFLFKVPLLGSVATLFFVTLPFILANLFVGMMISTLAKTQLEASQISLFFFLPSMLLSGFAFPFQGMPLWAQGIGNILPLTHFINMVRGIMLKGITFSSLWIDLWPLFIFMVMVLVVALKRYRQTLD